VVEISRRPEPAELALFRANHPSPADFNSEAFQPIKRSLKSQLNQDQGGLCAYCESDLPHNSGQIDHVKPKGGRRGFPELSFVYTNFVHSCCHNPKHCGQQKKDGILPIEPGPECNALFALGISDGIISPLVSANKQQREDVRQTIAMLGLNHSSLQLERKRWVESVREVLAKYPEDFPAFIKNKPFRFILQRLLA
jgi:uncharacterized protein (TIGR02646 family)